MQLDWSSVKKTIFLLLLIFIATGCYTTIWQARSPEEIEAFNEEIQSLPDSMLIIPEFNGEDTIPVIKFTSIGFMACWEYIVYNNGNLFYNGGFSKKITQTDIENLIFELNEKGLFGVSSKEIQDRIAFQRRACLFELFFPKGPSPVSTRFDVPTYTIQINLNDLDYHISYYDIMYAAEKFPTCKDIRILSESIEYLYRKMQEYEGN